MNDLDKIMQKLDRNEKTMRELLELLKRVLAQELMR